MRNKEKCVVASAIILSSLFSFSAFKGESSVVRTTGILVSNPNIIKKILTLAEANSTLANKARKPLAPTGLALKGPVQVIKLSKNTTLQSIAEDERKKLPKMDNLINFEMFKKLFK